MILIQFLVLIFLSYFSVFMSLTVAHPHHKCARFYTLYHNIIEAGHFKHSKHKTFQTNEIWRTYCMQWLLVHQIFSLYVYQVHKTTTYPLPGWKYKMILLVLSYWQVKMGICHPVMFKVYSLSYCFRINNEHGLCTVLWQIKACEPQACHTMQAFISKILSKFKLLFRDGPFLNIWSISHHKVVQKW